MLHLKVLCLNILLSFWFLKFSQGNNFTFTRNKRYLPLVFRNPATITFISGFGIPVHNLNPELVTVGMVFKAQQFLPTTNEALRHQANHSIHKREHRTKGIEIGAAANMTTTADTCRIMFYKALEQLSMSLGQAGRTCVLKMICEVAATPFVYQNGVLGEIMHILLTPSSTLDIKQLDKQHYVYMKAELNGRKSIKSCAELYMACNYSILDRITNLFD